MLVWITSVSGLVRYPGKSLSNSSCAWRTELVGGKYFSLIPPNDSLPTGIISKILTSLPQKPASTSSRVLVRCRRSASQFR
ncbi:Uncharacterised protein [Mycobacterium tuberculosis]|nr:Uncharacterised protein [Mycobacterium tuberculosis]